MIFADIHGKLGSDGFRAHERSEDVLTSTVFGLLRYIPPVAGFLPLMAAVRPVRIINGSTRALPEPGWLDLRRAVTCEVAFWPSLGDYGQPDALLKFLDAERRLVHSVLVEAKLFSPKSGSADEDDPAADKDQPDPDQLVRYWHGLARRQKPWDGVTASSQATLIYLTAHGRPPARELEDAIRREPRMRLGWLSWSDIWRVALAVPDGLPYSLPANDLARLLAHKGLKAFTGFRPTSVTVPQSGRFWNDNDNANGDDLPWFHASRLRNWVKGTAPREGLSPHFWEGH